MTSRRLLLRRLQILGRGRIVYDERFHAGVNIIRGQNGSGKSTIGEMIFYALGGEGVNWSTEAQQCDWVHAEVDLSGAIYTFRREMTGETDRPIAIYEGPLEAALSSATGWLNYGRKRSSSKESFSQFMFARLGFPESKSEESSLNITMHQVLRVLYSDQHTDATALFRPEKNPFADRSDLKKTIGEMLLGIDDLQGHAIRLEHLKLTKDLAAKEARLSSLLEAAEATDPHFRLSNYATLLREDERERDELERELRALSLGNEALTQYSPGDQARILELEKKLTVLNAEILSRAERASELARDILDSEAFLASLQNNLEELTSANAAVSIIGNVQLLYCPLCLADLQTPQEGHCVLCRSKVSPDAGVRGRLRYELELKHQIEESNKLLADRQANCADAKARTREATISRNRVLSELRALVAPEARIHPKVSELLRRQGYLTRKTEEMSRMQSLQENVIRLEGEVNNLAARQSALVSELGRRASMQEQRRSYCSSRIGDLTVEILHEDVVDTAQNTLRDASGFLFSFEKDFLTVRHGRLSASTQAFLKNSFHLALLKFGIEDPHSRLPNFLLLDNIEDKGMVPERFRKFHQLLIDYSDRTERTHQVILTTSLIDPELEGSKYCVGPSYDGPPFTLDLHGEWSKKERALRPGTAR